MSEVQGQLKKRGSIVLDSNGNGTIDYAVGSAWQRWEVDSVRVSTSQGSTTTPYPTVEIFTGYLTPGDSHGATWTGNNDVFSGLANVDVGNDLHIQFTGGPAGVTAYATVYGTRFTEIGGDD